jgi:hypothetical protein
MAQKSLHYSLMTIIRCDIQWCTICMLVCFAWIYCRMLKGALHGLNVPLLGSFPQFCRSLKFLEVLIDIVGSTQKRLHPFECVVLHAIERGRCLNASIDQKIEVQCFWIIGPAHLVPKHNQRGVTSGRNDVGMWQGKRGDGAESTYSRCIFSRPFKNGFNRSCTSTINCTFLSPSSRLVRYAIPTVTSSPPTSESTYRWSGGGRGGSDGGCYLSFPVMAWQMTSLLTLPCFPRFRWIFDAKGWNRLKVEVSHPQIHGHFNSPFKE